MGFTWSRDLYNACEAPCIDPRPQTRPEKLHRIANMDPPNSISFIILFWCPVGSLLQDAYKGKGSCTLIGNKSADSIGFSPLKWRSDVWFSSHLSTQPLRCCAEGRTYPCSSMESPAPGASSAKVVSVFC